MTDTPLPPCPQCSSPYAYEDGALLVCPECAHEWGAGAVGEASDGPIYRDANGAQLADGDTVSVIKDLKIKGTSQVVKVGTRVKNIRPGPGMEKRQRALLKLARWKCDVAG